MADIVRLVNRAEQSDRPGIHWSRREVAPAGTTSQLVGSGITNRAGGFSRLHQDDPPLQDTLHPPAAIPEPVGEIPDLPGQGKPPYPLPVSPLAGQPRNRPGIVRAVAIDQGQQADRLAEQSCLAISKATMPPNE